MLIPSYRGAINLHHVWFFPFTLFDPLLTLQHNATKFASPHGLSTAIFSKKGTPSHHSTSDSLQGQIIDFVASIRSLKIVAFMYTKHHLLSYH